MTPEKFERIVRGEVDAFVGDGWKLASGVRYFTEDAGCFGEPHVIAAAFVRGPLFADVLKRVKHSVLAAVGTKNIESFAAGFESDPAQLTRNEYEQLDPWYMAGARVRLYARERGAEKEST